MDEINDIVDNLIDELKAIEAKNNNDCYLPGFAELSLMIFFFLKRAKFCTVIFDAFAL